MKLSYKTLETLYGILIAIAACSALYVKETLSTNINIPISIAITIGTLSGIFMMIVGKRMHDYRNDN